ncbi:MAG: hypothetical protein PVH91_14645 [Pseudomonadales bacterium]|jgi:hypothetical protein
MATAMRTRFRILTLAMLGALGAASAGAQVAAPQLASYVQPSDKGGFQYSEPSPFPELDLDLTPIEREVAKEASTRCGTALAAAPLDLGDAEGVVGNLMGAAANAAIGQLLGGFLGGGGGSKQKPKLARDPIKNKYKERIEDPDGDVRIRAGGQAYSDGILISAKVEKARGKGTFHTMFLEEPDCTRIFPEQYLGYDLWGSWSLSVSVTSTKSTYQDGKLIDQSTSHSGWSKSGDFDFSRGFSLWDQLPGEDRKMLLNADQAYLAQLRREIDVPAWAAMGYAEPKDGIRSAGGIFRVAPTSLPPGTIAVIHITNVDHGRYRTVGFPLNMSFGEEGRITLTRLPDAPAE